MDSASIQISRTGLVTSVGLTAASSCAAIRGKISNPTDTRFISSKGDWIIGHSVTLAEPWVGCTKLSRMAVLAIEDCLQDIPRQDWTNIPLFLCVAERGRPGRSDGLDDGLFQSIQDGLQTRFSRESMVIPSGRIGPIIALRHARNIIRSGSPPRVLIAATDSLLSWPTLKAYDRMDRLLAPGNSNGFIAGEAAGALLLTEATEGHQLVVCGIGFGEESSRIDSEQPNRAEGLTLAIKSALREAACEIHELNFRISDISGEQYYFKEAALALSRIMRFRKTEFDIWHPAEAIGETGAVSALAGMALAYEGLLKDYLPGPGILFHSSNDDGQRAAAVLRSQVT